MTKPSDYRREGDTWLIEIRLRELRQLFHHLDPAPYREKDLDPAAEAYIDDAVREIGLAFMFGCLTLRRWLAALGSNGVFTEGLLLIGWVALWRPVEISSEPVSMELP